MQRILLVLSSTLPRQSSARPFPTEPPGVEGSQVDKVVEPPVTWKTDPGFSNFGTQELPVARPFELGQGENPEWLTPNGRETSTRSPSRHHHPYSKPPVAQLQDDLPNARPTSSHQCKFDVILMPDWWTDEERRLLMSLVLKAANNIGAKHPFDRVSPGSFSVRNSLAESEVDRIFDDHRATPLMFMSLNLINDKDIEFAKRRTSGGNHFVHVLLTPRFVSPGSMSPGSIGQSKKDEVHNTLKNAIELLVEINAETHQK